MIEKMKPKSTLAGSELQDGDIITVQRVLSDKELGFDYVSICSRSTDSDPDSNYTTSSCADVSVSDVAVSDPAVSDASVSDMPKFNYSYSNLILDDRTSVISANGNYTNVQDFYDYLLNRVSVTFAPKVTTANDDAKFVLTLSKKMSYDQFAEKVGEHLRVDPTHLRFSTVNYNSGRAKAPVRRTQNQTLGHILQGAFTNFGANQTQRTDCLIYEVLELSLTELESRKNVKVHWLPEGITKQVHHPPVPLLRTPNIPTGTLRHPRPQERHHGRRVGLAAKESKSQRRDDATSPHLRSARREIL